MIILAIETSCDETAVAVVEFRKNKVNVLSNIVSSQIKAHSKFGGVVPSLAARMHLRNMVPVLKRALKFSKELSSEASELSSFENKIDYITVTKGPGLIPALTIGVSAAKALAYSWDKPLIGVNHLEGHIYSNWLRSNDDVPHPSPLPRGEGAVFPFHKGGWGDFVNLWKPEFPVLCLIVSGGHTQLILMKKDLKYKIIGETMDDAAGEAFDKVAKLLGLGYPGGPLIEKIAKKGDKNKFKFPRPMMNSGNYNFSFSGLKTAVLYEVRSGTCWLHSGDSPVEPECKLFAKRLHSSAETMEPTQKRKENNSEVLINDQYQANVAASFQEAVIDVLVSKTIRAAKQYKVKNIILGGGVSANKELQKRLKKAINKEMPSNKFSARGGPALGWQIPNSKLTTDNALMIAVAGYYNIINNKNIKSWKNVKADANLKLK